MIEKQTQKQEIEKGLQILVETAKNCVSNLTEIRVFGSYNNKGWNLQNSDIDIYIEINDLNSSFISGIDNNENYKKVYGIRRAIKQALKGNLIEKKVHVDILNKEDIKKLWDKEYIPGKGPYGQNVKEGKLLFPIIH